MKKDLHVRLMQPNRASRNKRWDMILRNLRTPGKYVLPSVALALSGCVASPNVVSVSPDGRYVVVPMNESGVTSKLTQPSRLVLIDTDTREVKSLTETAEGVYWVDAAPGVAVYNAFDKKGKNHTVSIVQDGKTTPVQGAMFPTLSDDGQQLVYVGLPKGEE